VGTRIAVDHVRPSAVGTEVTCTAQVAEIDGRIVTFKVQATQHQDDQEVLVGRGVVTRAIVEREAFLAKLQP